MYSEGGRYDYYIAISSARPLSCRKLGYTLAPYHLPIIGRASLREGVKRIETKLDHHHFNPPNSHGFSWLFSTPYNTESASYTFAHLEPVRYLLTSLKKKNPFRISHLDSSWQTSIGTCKRRQKKQNHQDNKNVYRCKKGESPSPRIMK